MGQKTVKFNEEGISELPNDKPAVYKILTSNDNNNYTGVAQRGRVRERIMEHLTEIPGAKVRIEQMRSTRKQKKKKLGSSADRSPNTIRRNSSGSETIREGFLSG